jgi:hypothetical protein
VIDFGKIPLVQLTKIILVVNQGTKEKLLKLGNLERSSNFQKWQKSDTLPITLGLFLISELVFGS